MDADKKLIINRAFKYCAIEETYDDYQSIRKEILKSTGNEPAESVYDDIQEEKLSYAQNLIDPRTTGFE